MQTIAALGFFLLCCMHIPETIVKETSIEMKDDLYRISMQ